MAELQCESVISENEHRVNDYAFKARGVKKKANKINFDLAKHVLFPFFAVDLGLAEAAARFGGGEPL